MHKDKWKTEIISRWLLIKNNIKQQIMGQEGEPRVLRLALSHYKRYLLYISTMITYLRSQLSKCLGGSRVLAVERSSVLFGSLVVTIYLSIHVLCTITDHEDVFLLLKYHCQTITVL